MAEGKGMVGGDGSWPTFLYQTYAFSCTTNQHLALVPGLGWPGRGEIEGLAQVLREAYVLGSSGQRPPLYQ
jgi:hypothetical protein